MVVQLVPLTAERSETGWADWWVRYLVVLLGVTTAVLLVGYSAYCWVALSDWWVATLVELTVGTWAV